MRVWPTPFEAHLAFDRSLDAKESLAAHGHTGKFDFESFATHFLKERYPPASLGALAIECVANTTTTMRTARSASKKKTCQVYLQAKIKQSYGSGKRVSF